MFEAAAIDAQTITSWQGFFTMAAGASAGLAGLVFVALSMHLKGIRNYPPYQYRTRSSLASMMLIFVLSSLMLFPAQTREWLGLEWLIVIGADGAFLIWTFLQARKAVAKHPHGLTSIQPYQRRTTLAIVTCLFGMLGASLVWAGLEVGFYIVAIFSIITMVWVVINAWALVVGIAEEETSESPISK